MIAFLELIEVGPSKIGCRSSVELEKSQFIHERRAEELCAELEAEGTDCSKVRKWLSGGAKPRYKETRALEEIHAGISHLILDLEKLDPTFPCRDVIFQGEENCAATEHIKTVQENVKGAPVVLSTHAMLAYKIISHNPENDSPWSHLVIDEGHLLEETFASSLSADVSIMLLRSYVRKKGGKVAAKLDAVKAIFKRLQNEKPSVYLTNRELEEDVRALAKNLSKLIRGKKEEDLFWKNQLGRVGDENDFRIGLSLSPVRKFPSITVGPPSVAKLLEKLWNSVDGAALMSGTLYLPLKNGTMSNAYQRLKLRIPSERTCAQKPITAPWIMNTPSLYIPKKEDHEKFTWDYADEERRKEWEAEVSNTVAGKIAPNAKGGTLILCCSKEEASNLRRDLSKRHKLCDRVLDDASVIAGREQFVQKYREGIKPIWLAIGPAWTGLDLRDSTTVPSKDFLLTDLVIPRVPFNFNRTSTHISRKEWMGFSAEVCETTIRFRQGLGRLIRSDNLQERNIWVLDARIWTKPSNRLIRQALTGYSKRFEID